MALGRTHAHSTLLSSRACRFAKVYFPNTGLRKWWPVGQKTFLNTMATLFSVPMPSLLMALDLYAGKGGWNFTLPFFKTPRGRVTNTYRKTRLIEETESLQEITASASNLPWALVSTLTPLFLSIFTHVTWRQHKQVNIKWFSSWDALNDQRMCCWCSPHSCICEHTSWLSRISSSAPSKGCSAVLGSAVTGSVYPSRRLWITFTQTTFTGLCTKQLQDICCWFTQSHYSNIK